MEIEQIETHGNCTHGNLFTLQLDPDSLPAQDIVERKAFILSNQPLSRTATEQQTQHSDKFVSDDLDVTALKKEALPTRLKQNLLFIPPELYTPPSIPTHPNRQMQNTIHTLKMMISHALSVSLHAFECPSNPQTRNSNFDTSDDNSLRSECQQKLNAQWYIPNPERKLRK
jgi:hypothetical protein